MATIALTDDQKEQLRASSKFLPMIRTGAYRKSNFWAITTDPTAVPGGQTVANIIRWAKSRSFSAQIINDPSTIDRDQNNFGSLFLINLTQAVWDNSVSFNPDTVILNMEANSAAMIDAPMDSTFDNKIKYALF